MSSQPPSCTFESRDTVLVEFKDTDLVVDTSIRPASDDFVRHYISQEFATDLKNGPQRPDLDRLLALAREREQFCRGANDFFGLARCLGNQALIQKARGQLDEAMTLLKQLEPLCRRIDDVEGMAFALLAGPLGQSAAALPLAEQGQRLATENHLTQLADYIGPILQRLR
jgi:hypothetical protein